MIPNSANYKNSKNILIANGAEYLGSEEIKMKICYPNSVGESNTKKSHRKFFRFDLKLGSI